jgi:hypothetical protein
MEWWFKNNAASAQVEGKEQNIRGPACDWRNVCLRSRLCRTKRRWWLTGVHHAIQVWPGESAWFRSSSQEADKTVVQVPNPEGVCDKVREESIHEIEWHQLAVHHNHKGCFSPAEIQDRSIA